jgi:crotonobetainyl-CoA:carnitine CoA-transferase CaiB-like acyl-CoA transferase
MQIEGAQPPRRPTPERGEHTEDVLKEFGLTAEEIAALRGKGAI